MERRRVALALSGSCSMQRASSPNAACTSIAFVSSTEVCRRTLSCRIVTVLPPRLRLLRLLHATASRFHETAASSTDHALVVIAHLGWPAARQHVDAGRSTRFIGRADSEGCVCADVASRRRLTGLRDERDADAGPPPIVAVSVHISANPGSIAARPDYRAAIVSARIAPPIGKHAATRPCAYTPGFPSPVPAPYASRRGR